MDIEFSNSISPEYIKTVAENVANAIYNEINGEGIAPETDDSPHTIRTRIMCKDVVLLTEEYKTDGLRHIVIQDINGVMVQDPIEEKCEDAVDLLRNILCESGMECEYDREIHAFLEEHNELPDDYSPYWEEEDNEEESAIGEDEVKRVISDLKTFQEANFTEEEIKKTIERFNGEAEEDPSASWNLVIEKILYDLLDEREDEKE